MINIISLYDKGPGNPPPGKKPYSINKCKDEKPRTSARNPIGHHPVQLQANRKYLVNRSSEASSETS